MVLTYKKGTLNPVDSVGFGSGGRRPLPPAAPSPLSAPSSPRLPPPSPAAVAPSSPPPATPENRSVASASPTSRGGQLRHLLHHAAPVFTFAFMPGGCPAVGRRGTEATSHHHPRIAWPCLHIVNCHHCQAVTVRTYPIGEHSYLFAQTSLILSCIFILLCCHTSTF